MVDEPLALPDDVRSQHGETLVDLSRSTPILVVCLRHGGCSFCREALADLSRGREAIEQAGTRIVLVHMMDDERAAALFARYGLDAVPRFSDPDRRVYEALGLRRASTWKVMGPGMWGRAIGSILGGHFPGIPREDIHQMPGTFLLADGRIVRSFVHENSGDRPDYCALARPESTDPP